MREFKKHISLLSLIILAGLAFQCSKVKAPYPQSKIVKEVIWHASTYQSGAEGSDLFPTTTAGDGNIYTAWGDGKGFNGDTKKSYGISMIEGNPPSIRASDVSYGPNGIEKGKIIDILSVGGTIYGILNTQDDKWPFVSYQITRSDNLGKDWHRLPWKWPKGEGAFEPRRFMHVGKDDAQPKEGYVYIYGRKKYDPSKFYLARTLGKNIENKDTYEFFMGNDTSGKDTWSVDFNKGEAIFSDSNIKEFRFNSFCVLYNQPLDRYFAVTGYGDAGQIGIFEASEPWGSWFTVAYYDQWLGMSGGYFLSMSFPGKWTSSDGKVLYAVFSVHGHPTPSTYHDKFNLIKTSLILADDANQ